ncbi:hypothetical protein K7432_011970 [Basidiobolus ranarum]|uniref:Uncharacterized protein n=1 Tax=Basidiobolus ranarum TaxID=34480 RepID=A0ABR2WLE5_9FUNG
MKFPSTDPITRQSSILIKPVTPSKNTVVALSPLDNIIPVYAFNFQFIYKNEKNDANFMHPDAMKASLAKLLVDFPTMAGRALMVDKKWYIHSNDAGVRLDIGRASMKLEDLAIGDYDQLPHGLRVQWTCPEDPVWQVYITYFICGGVMIVSEMFHQVGDGETNAVLMHKWAKLHSNQPYAPPVFDPSLIRASGDSPPTSIRLWEKGIDARSFRELDKNLSLSTAKLIKFSAQELQAMKRDAQGFNNNNISWISINDALSAHMWRLITKARDLPANTMTSLVQVHNARKKIQPALTSDYVGNVLMYCQTDPVAANELVTSHLAPLAAFSRHSVNRITPAFTQKFVDWISSTSDVKPVNIEITYGPDVLVSSWRSFDLYTVSFENGEKPYFAGENPNLFDGMLKLVEGKEMGSIYVHLSLPRIHMEKLLTDPELHKYATIDLADDGANGLP